MQAIRCNDGRWIALQEGMRYFSIGRQIYFIESEHMDCSDDTCSFVTYEVINPNNMFPKTTIRTIYGEIDVKTIDKQLLKELRTVNYEENDKTYYNW